MISESKFKLVGISSRSGKGITMSKSEFKPVGVLLRMGYVGLGLERGKNISKSKSVKKKLKSHSKPPLEAVDGNERSSSSGPGPELKLEASGCGTNGGKSRVSRSCCVTVVSSLSNSARSAVLKAVGTCGYSKPLWFPWLL